MKEHITPKQLKEIQKDEFYSLFDNIVHRKDWYRFHHHKMTVGKLIAINDKYINKINITHEKPKYIIDTTIGIIQGNCLCDVLWELTKMVINKKVN